MGTIDAWAEAESVDVRAPGDLMLMYGSTMFFVGVTAETALDAALWSTPGNHAGQHTLAAGMASSGSITEWFRELTGDAGLQRARHLRGSSARPAAMALLTLPYFGGERTPVADPELGASSSGSRSSHTRADINRALLEATAFGVRHNFARLRRRRCRADRLVAVGGGTTESLWPQIVSDITGRPRRYPPNGSAPVSASPFRRVGTRRGRADRQMEYD